MKTQVTFHCPGVAKSERKRQRFIAGKGRVGARTDEPDRADFKARLAIFAKQAFAEPLTGPLYMRLVVRRPQPQSYPKKPTNSNPWPWADVKKPDCDNYAKIVQDSLNGIAWVDDAQIVRLEVLKLWGSHGVTVTVAQVDESELQESDAA